MKVNGKKALAAATALCVVLTSSPVFAKEGDYFRSGPTSGDKVYDIPTDKDKLIADVKAKASDDKFYKEVKDGKYVDPSEEQKKQREKLVALLAAAGVDLNDEQAVSEYFENADNDAAVEAALAEGTTETKKLELGEIASSLKVLSVSAINLKEISVTFNKEVDKATAETAGNYTLSSGTAIVSAELQADKKTVLLTLVGAKAQQDTDTLTVKGIKDLSEKTLEETKNDLTYSDVVRPTAEKAELVGPKLLKIYFSEPMNAVPTFKLGDGSISMIADPAFAVGARSMTFKLGSVLPNGTHKVEVSGGQDFAGFKIDKKEVSFDVAADVNAPVVSVDKASEGQVTLKFNKPVKVMKPADVSVYHSMNNAATYKGSAPAAVNPDANGYTDTYTVTFTTPIPGGSGKTLFINTKKDAWEDAWGNDVETTSLTFNVVSDTAAPTVVKAELTGKGMTAQKELTLTFDEEIDAADAVGKPNYVLKDASGKVLQTADFADVDNQGKFNANATLAYDATKKQVVISLTNPLEAAEYQLDVSNIKDTSFLKNAMTTQNVKFTVEDTIPPTVGASTHTTSASGGDIYLNFSEPMNNADLVNRNNYRLEIAAVSKPLPAEAVVSIVNAQKVKISIPNTAAYPVTGNTVTVQVLENVRDLAGNPIGGLVANSTNNITWATASTFTIVAGAKDVKVVGRNQLQFEVDELSAVDISKFTVTAAGITGIDGVTYASSDTPGKSIVTVITKEDFQTTDLTQITNLTIAAGGLTNAEGVALAGVGVTFTTAAGHFEDQLEPEVKKVELTKVNEITLTFTEDLKAGDVANASFMVEGNEVDGVDNSVLNVVKLTLATPVATDATPKVTLNAGAQIRDANGNVMKSDVVIPDTQDKVKPTASYVVHATVGGHWGQTLGDKIVITFSEPIRPATLNIDGIANNGDTSASTALKPVNNEIFAVGKVGTFDTQPGGANVGVVEAKVALDDTGTIVTVTVTKVGAAVDSPSGDFTKGNAVEDLNGNK